MSENKTSTIQLGGLFSTLWVVAMATLKLTGAADISWWIVFMPWVVTGGILAAFLVFLVILLVVAMLGDR